MLGPDARILIEDAGEGTYRSSALLRLSGTTGQTRGSPISNESVHILVVDDSPAKVLALSSLLEQPDLVVVTAASGDEALRLLLRGEFAVILLDVSMPVLDGFETASLIRQRPHTAATPIIFITASWSRSGSCSTPSPPRCARKNSSSSRRPWPTSSR